MQVSIETTTGLERRLTVGLPAEQIDSEVLERLQKATKTARIDGFRPGKVPLKLIRQRFGSGVRREVVGELLSRSFYDAVAEHQLRPAGPPEIQHLADEPGQDLEYVATFEVYPEITLADFSQFEIIKPVAEITEADVDTVIESLRKQRAKWVETEREAVDGDQVNVDFVGTRDGQAFDGGKGDGVDLILGSGRMLPGFEAGLVGARAGESRTVVVQCPEDYRAEELRGAELSFDIRVNRVRESQPAPLDRDFFALFGVTDGDEQAFRAKVRENMERELARATRAKIKARVMHELFESHPIPIPNVLIQHEIRGLRQQVLGQFGGAQPFDPEMFPDELFLDQAKRRGVLGLLMVEIAKSAQIAVDAQRVRSHIEELAAAHDQPEQVVQYYYQEERLLGGVQAAVLEDQVVEHVLAIAKTSEESVGYEDVLKPDPRPVAAAAEEIDSAAETGDQ